MLPAMDSASATITTTHDLRRDEALRQLRVTARRRGATATWVGRRASGRVSGRVRGRARPVSTRRGKAMTLTGVSERPADEPNGPVDFDRFHWDRPDARWP